MKKTAIFFSLSKRILSHFKFYLNRYVSDHTFLEKKYKKIFGRPLNLSNPVYFTEKIQWLKLNERRKIYTQCADKFLVREYVKHMVGEIHLIPLVFVTENSANINKKNLPNYPVIIKTTHDSGGTFVIKDRNKTDFHWLQKQIKAKLSKNFYFYSREWEYKNIKPRIIVEKLLSNTDENDMLNDYKIHCFHGEPAFIQTIFDRSTELKEDWYDIEWNHLAVSYFSEKGCVTAKPKMLNDLLRIAKALAQPFPYVRVDLYIYRHRIYFGELTFRPYGGWMKFTPTKFDLTLGNMLHLDKMSTIL